MSSSKRGIQNNSFIPVFGLIFVVLGVLLLILIYFPVIGEEIKYAVRQSRTKSSIIPANQEFSIVIPKISANAPIIKNVDPFDQGKYQLALSKGVAHAAGSAFPGHVGNIFLFAHSSADWFIANRYNSVFYLLHKLEKGDEIDVFYEQKKYVYKVMEKKLVKPSEISYIHNSSMSKLTLMTCWPPGTSIKRLIIEASP